MTNAIPYYVTRDMFGAFKKNSLAPWCFFKVTIENRRGGQVFIGAEIVGQ